MIRVQLVKSFCLPLITYCIGAMNLKYSAVQQLSLCWNDAFRYIFRFKRSESVNFLQVNFGTLDFKHLYDVFRLKFLMTIINRYAYTVSLAEILNFQYHMLVYIADKYNGGSKCSIVSSIYRHCADLCYL